ncbi:MAG: hypothetical protein K9N51_02745 [Candidatus Pacebacteria bacterium]|nr:hypothetical protein [Candidatus Paceibacterota bacterium]
MIEPILWREIDIPSEFCTTERVNHRTVTFGGDIRVGDLCNSKHADFLVYRSVDNAHDEGGMKPCFMGAFTAKGEPIWRVGGNGTQPSRPGPVAIHDIDGDGRSEVICFWYEGHVDAPPTSMANVVLQIRDGATGRVKKEARPAPLRLSRGEGPNWVHQRLLITNLQGLEEPRDFIVKLGAKVLAFNSSLDILWEYESPWTQYGQCPAYIPAVGDIDGDGRDEVNGGYFLLDHDGEVLWEKKLAPHTDSVAILPWDNGRMRAVCSGHGHVLDANGNVVLKLGGDLVPHGQEVRVGRFRSDTDHPQMVIRFNGHSTAVRVVDVEGTILKQLDLNPSPNNTGMEVVRWNGKEGPDVLYNGGMLWDPLSGKGVPLPGLPQPKAIGRMDWYHCIPADVCGDQHEEVVLYNPWMAKVYIYTQADNDTRAPHTFTPGPRQYNPRLMD